MRAGREAGPFLVGARCGPRAECDATLARRWVILLAKDLKVAAGVVRPRDACGGQDVLSQLRQRAARRHEVLHAMRVRLERSVVAGWRCCGRLGRRGSGGPRAADQRGGCCGRCLSAEDDAQRRQAEGLGSQVAGRDGDRACRGGGRLGVPMRLRRPRQAGQTAAQKVVKKPTAKGKSGKSAGDAKANASDTSDSGGAAGKSNQTNGTSNTTNGSRLGRWVRDDERLGLRGGGGALQVHAAFLLARQGGRREGSLTASSYMPRIRERLRVLQGRAGRAVLHGWHGADVAGDVGYAMMYSQAIGDHHVEVWAPNWPWLVADANANGSLDSFGGLHAGVEDVDRPFHWREDWLRPGPATW